MQAVVSEAVNLEGLVQQLRNSIQEHVQRVMASEAVAPYVTTGPLCDFATQWSPESYMVRKQSKGDSNLRREYSLPGVARGLGWSFQADVGVSASFFVLLLHYALFFLSPPNKMLKR
jgi:hypothetical protein